MKTNAYGNMLATYVGFTILFTYFRYAEWFDAVSRLRIPENPFFFGYEEGLIRGAVLGLFVAACIFWIFNKFKDVDKCRPVTSALWIFALYSAATGISFLTQPRAYDPGLALELMIPGFSAVVSTWLYAGNVVLKAEPLVLDQNIALKWIELNHKETTEAITSLALVVVAGITLAGYNYLHMGQIMTLGQSDPTFAWYTFSLQIFDFGLVAIGFAIFTMAPLFMRLDILKAKLKNASISPGRRRTH